MGAVLQDVSNRAANAQEPSLLWHFQGECAELPAGGDWDDVIVLNGAIMALAGKTKGKGTAMADLRAKEARKAQQKAEMGSTGTATTAEPVVIKAHCRHLDVEMDAKGRGNKGKEDGKGLCYVCWNQ